MILVTKWLFLTLTSKSLINGILLPKLIRPTVRKKCSSSNREKKAEGREFEITITIFSNSERSETFLVTESFFNLFLEAAHI